jgi:DNA gyrase subunit A
VSEIREMGRATQGVTLINVDDGSTLSGVRRVVESDADDDLDEADGATGQDSDSGMAPPAAPDDGPTPEA